MVASTPLRSRCSRELQLRRFDVHACELHAWELLPENAEHRADAAADVEEARARRQLRPVGDQAMPPVLGLLDEPLLLARPVAVDVFRHEPRLGVTPGAGSA